MAISFTQFEKNLNSLNSGLELKKAIELTKVDAIDLNKDQMLSGRDSDDKLFTSYASPYYARRKQRLNSAPPYGTPDLKLTGDYQDAMFGDVIQEGDTVRLVINSSDYKRRWLIDWYPNQFGLTTDNSKDYIKKFKPIFNEGMKKQIFKNG